MLTLEDLVALCFCTYLRTFFFGVKGRNLFKNGSVLFLKFISLAHMTLCLNYKVLD